MLCPECAGVLHRSHSHGVRENVVKKVSNYKAYRCAECGWRGMAAPVKTSSAARVKIFFLMMIGIIATCAMAVMASKGVD